MNEMKRFFGYKKGFLRKMAVCVVAVMFFISSLPSVSDARLDISAPVHGPEGKDLTLSGVHAELDVETFSIPEHLGEVRYSNRGEGHRTVIHIQDAHCNYFAHQKISSIIDYLNKEYGIRVLNLEGGAGEYDLSVFTNISGGEIRREVAEYFLKRGEVNGAEFYAINNMDRVSLWGIEDRELYMKNLAVYRDSLRYQEEVEGYLKELGYIFNNLKRHIFTPDLLRIDTAYSAYKAGNMEFREYLSFLIKNAREMGVSVKTFPNIYLIAQAMEKEDSVDFRKANAERTVLIDRMKSILSPAEMRELVSTTVRFRTKRISLKEFYNYLLLKARECGFDLSGYPALSGYIVYVSLFDAVDRFKVMEELDDLERTVKEPLFRNDTERELDFLSKNLALKGNIFMIMLTKNDYVYYESNRDSFSVERFLRFIAREAPRYGLTARPSPEISRLDNYLAEMTMFYEYSFARDEAFVENMIFSEIPAGGEAAIIMTGGFHTENLCVLFEELGYSYVSIMPKFTMEKDYVSPYFDLLAGQTADIQQMLRSALAQSAMMQIASMLNNLGRDVWGDEGIDTWKTSVVLITFMLADGDAGVEALRSGITGIDIQDGQFLVAISGKDVRVVVPVRDVMQQVMGESYYAQDDFETTWSGLEEKINDQVLADDLRARVTDQAIPYINMVVDNLDPLNEEDSEYLKKLTGNKDPYDLLDPPLELRPRNVNQYLVYLLYNGHYGILPEREAISLLFNDAEKGLVADLIGGNHISRLFEMGPPEITWEDINDFISIKGLGERRPDHTWFNDVREQIIKDKTVDIENYMRSKGTLIGEGDVSGVIDALIEKSGKIYEKMHIIQDQEREYYDDWRRLHELVADSGVSPLAVTSLRKGYFDRGAEREGASASLSLIFETIGEGDPDLFLYSMKLADPNVSEEEKIPQSANQHLFYLFHQAHLGIVREMLSYSQEERARLISSYNKFFDEVGPQFILEHGGAILRSNDPDMINLGMGPYVVSGDTVEEKILNLTKSAILKEAIVSIDIDEGASAWEGEYERLLSHRGLATPDLASLAGNIGKFVVDGELVTNMATRQEVRNGAEHLVVTDRDSGFEAWVQITREASDRELEGLVKNLKELKEGQPGIPNTLTSGEKEKLGKIIDEITDRGITLIAMDERIMGHFGANGKIYLNQDLLTGSPLAILHELIHGFYPSVEGVSRHTLARGAGEDARLSLKVLLKEKYPTIDAVQTAGVEQFIGELNDGIRETALRELTDDEKNLIRHNFNAINERTIVGEIKKEYGPEIFLFGLQDHMDPEGNLALTAEIRGMRDKIRRGAYNIVFDETRNIRSRSSAESMARKTSRKYRREWGVDTSYKAFEDTSKEGLREVLSIALVETSTQDYGMALIKCISPESVKAFNELIEEEFSEISDKVIVLYSPVESPEEHNENVPRLLHMANQLLNYKRMETYFGLNAEDPMMVDLGREMVEHFERAQYLGRDSISEHLGKGVPSITALSAGDLSELLKGLFRGAVPVTITKINWEEIRDYISSMQAIYTSL